LRVDKVRGQFGARLIGIEMLVKIPYPEAWRAGSEGFERIGVTESAAG